MQYASLDEIYEAPTLKQRQNSYDYIIKTHKDFFLELERDGDELSWHPHFWKYDKQLSIWYQECYDVPWQTNMLREAHASYQNILPGRAKSVRMGWDFHNNETIGTLEELGVEVDFSGIPGLKLDPKNRDHRATNFFDWYLSPNKPYYPSNRQDDLFE